MSSSALARAAYLHDLSDFGINDMNVETIWGHDDDGCELRIPALSQPFRLLIQDKQEQVWIANEERGLSDRGQIEYIGIIQETGSPLTANISEAKKQELERKRKRFLHGPKHCFFYSSVDYACNSIVDVTPTHSSAMEQDCILLFPTRTVACHDVPGALLLCEGCVDKTPVRSFASAVLEEYDDERPQKIRRIIQKQPVLTAEQVFFRAWIEHSKDWSRERARIFFQRGFDFDELEEQSVDGVDGFFEVRRDDGIDHEALSNCDTNVPRVAKYRISVTGQQHFQRIFTAETLAEKIAELVMHEEYQTCEVVDSTVS